MAEHGLRPVTSFLAAKQQFIDEGALAVSANILSIDEESLRKDIKNLVRKTVDETFGALLDEESSEFVGTERYERTAGR